MDQKKTDKATHPLEVSISIAKPEVSIVRNEAFIMTLIDFQYIGGIKATAVNMIYLEKPSPDKIPVFEVVRNSKEP